MKISKNLGVRLSIVQQRNINGGSSCGAHCYEQLSTSKANCFGSYPVGSSQSQTCFNNAEMNFATCMSEACGEQPY